jgi:uncharacterized protein
MLLNLSQIRGPHESFDKTYEAEAFSTGHESFQVVGPVALSLDIFKDNAQVRLVGSVRAALELSCSRCVEPFVLPVDASFDLRYQPFAANTGEDEREIAEDDLSTAFYENDTIDLGQLMREQFYLALPMKPLCREACLGLCPECGTNLNEGTCGCRRGGEDPRLAAVKAFDRRTDH